MKFTGFKISEIFLVNNVKLFIARFVDISYKKTQGFLRHLHYRELRQAFL